MRTLIGEIGFWSAVALGAAAVLWLGFFSPWWLALPVATSLIAYSFTRDAHVRWAWSSYHDGKTGGEVVVHRRNELAFRYLGTLMVVRLLLNSLQALS